MFCPVCGKDVPMLYKVCPVCHGYCFIQIIEGKEKKEPKRKGNIEE